MWYQDTKLPTSEWYERKLLCVKITNITIERISESAWQIVIAYYQTLSTGIDDRVA